MNLLDRVSIIRVCVCVCVCVSVCVCDHSMCVHL